MRYAWRALPFTLGVVVSLAACGGGGSAEVTTADARAVTAEESQALAMTRVRNLEAGTRAVSFAVVDQGTQVNFDGWFDYATDTGYGLLTTESTSDVVLWNHGGLAAAPHDGASAPLPVPTPQDPSFQWHSGPLDPASSSVHSLLGVVAALGSDRPENPLLLSGSGALWLAERTLHDMDLMVLSGPPSEQALPPGESADPEAATVRYWIEPTGLAHRVDVRVGAGGEWVAVDFGVANGVTIDSPVAESGDSL